MCCLLSLTVVVVLGIAFYKCHVNPCAVFFFFFHKSFMGHLFGIMKINKMLKLLCMSQITDVRQGYL